MSYSTLNSIQIIKELELAANRRFPFFCCRLPDTDMHLTAYASTDCNDRRLRPGLVLAPFENRPERRLIFDSPVIYDSEAHTSNVWNKDPFFPFPTDSASREAHIAMVRRIIERLKHRKEHGIACKTVASRVKIAEITSNPRDIYMRLCCAYPSVLSFIVNSPESGQWIGASPELLLRTEGRLLKTMALAGTRPADTPGEWDDKNIEEQAIVARFITERLRSVSRKIECGPTYTRKAGPVEHLCCDITAELPEESSVEKRLLALDSLLQDLSPTPALCGYPREEAFCDIADLETYERGYYGGYLGAIAENGDCNLFANLRSMRIDGKKAALIAGGGIMPESEPEAEWEETERKASTLLRYL